MSTDVIGRARADRWRTCAEILSAVRRRPGLTRVELGDRLGLSSASTTETLARLRDAGWLVERRAPVTGRGRPTTVVEPDPDGPVVLALDLRHADWRLASAGLDGVPTTLARGPRGDDLPARLADAVRAATGPGARARPRALGVAAPAPLADDTFVRATELDWGSLGLAGLVSPLGDPTVPVLPGNDATLAGLAEARSGAATDAPTALFLTVEVGLGGALLLDGRPQTGARGTAGEYGHLPFGDPSRPCPCGASGCWGPEVDGRGLAVALGAPPPDDPRAYADQVCDAADRGERDAATAVARAGTALGRGVAGLINAHDPDVVVLGGLAPRLRGAAFDHALDGGLMGFRRAARPAIRDAAHGTDAALRGAAALALDHATSPEALARAAG